MSEIQRAKFADLSALKLHEIIKLRTDVFVVEQACAYPELDGRDIEPSTDHLWIDDADGEVRAYLRVLDDGPMFRIGRVVTRPDARGKGLAAELMTKVLDMSIGPWVLDAQTYLVDWYVGFGFYEAGPEFVEDGIPHVPMRHPAR